MNVPPPLARLREDLDAIDDRLLDLLNERVDLVHSIGRLKAEIDLPVYDPAREKVVLARLLGRNRGPLDEGAVRRLFERIIDESRRLEREAVTRHQTTKDRP